MSEKDPLVLVACLVASSDEKSIPLFQNLAQGDPLAAAAIADFEKSTKHKDFSAFHIEQARKYKRDLSEATNSKTKNLLAKATIHSRLLAVKTFFFWLAGQPGYKSRISYSDCEYFNPSANDSRIANAKRQAMVALGN